jgi:hypothetical protein
VASPPSILMDLWRRHLPRHANAVWNSYLTKTGDLAGLSLMRLFLSCRAAIRPRRAQLRCAFSGLAQDVALPVTANRNRTWSQLLGTMFRSLSADGCVNIRRVINADRRSILKKQPSAGLHRGNARESAAGIRTLELAFVALRVIAYRRAARRCQSAQTFLLPPPGTRFRVGRT